ncbi:MAG TPA: ATP-binding protein [Anaerolineae bacterium]|nr:ATP-binding protein [Anaerolineae bacterium]HMR63027.1 ATP-binding protein [Anaerolineae bacterium]
MANQLYPPPLADNLGPIVSTGFLKTMLLTLLGIGLVVPLSFFFAPPKDLSFFLAIFLAVDGCLTLLLWLLQQGWVRLVAMLIPLLLWTGFTIPILTIDGIRDTAVVGYYLTVVVAALSLGGTGVIVWGGICVLTLVTAFLTELYGWIQPSIPFPAGLLDLVSVIMALIGVVLLMRYAVLQITHSYDQLRGELAERQRTEVALRQSEASHLALLEQTQATLLETESLYRISRNLVRVDNLPALLQTMADEIMATLASHWVAVITLDLERRQVLDLVLGGQNLKTVNVDFDELMSGLTGWAIREMKPVISPRGRPDPRESEAVQQRREHNETGSIVVVPLHYRGKVLGTLTAGHHFTGPDFTPREIDLLVAIGSQASSAIEIARLYEQTQRELVVRQRAEEALKVYAAKLERSNDELQNFANVASHDMQEPLRKIQTFGDRLQHKYAATLDAQGHDYLSRMQSAANRMQILIQDLLTLSRITTKARPFEPVDLAEIVRQVLVDLEVRLEQVKGHVDVGQLPILQADPVQMRQLFQNLISNALKFHRRDVPPCVSISWTNELNHTDGLGHIIVRDNGIGFDEKYSDRIFQAFQRLHGQSEYEGTGIGLATCRKIVERHGGQISVTSQPGHGSTFKVALPVWPTPPADG